MNPRPNITSYNVFLEDGGGNVGKWGLWYRTTKYYQFWMFGGGRSSLLDLGTTSANTCFHSLDRCVFVLSEIDCDIDQRNFFDNEEEPETEPRKGSDS